MVTCVLNGVALSVSCPVRTVEEGFNCVLKGVGLFCVSVRTEEEGFNCVLKVLACSVFQYGLKKKVSTVS